MPDSGNAAPAGMAGARCGRPRAGQPVVDRTGGSRRHRRRAARSRRRRPPSDAIPIRDRAADQQPPPGRCRHGPRLPGRARTASRCNQAKTLTPASAATIGASRSGGANAGANATASRPTAPSTPMTSRPGRAERREAAPATAAATDHGDPHPDLQQQLVQHRTQRLPELGEPRGRQPDHRVGHRDERRRARRRERGRELPERQRGADGQQPAGRQRAAGRVARRAGHRRGRRRDAHLPLFAPAADPVRSRGPLSHGRGTTGPPAPLVGIDLGGPANTAVYGFAVPGLAPGAATTVARGGRGTARRRAGAADGRAPARLPVRAGRGRRRGGRLGDRRKVLHRSACPATGQRVGQPASTGPALRWASPIRETEAACRRSRPTTPARSPTSSTSTPPARRACATAPGSRSRCGAARWPRTGSPPAPTRPTSSGCSASRCWPTPTRSASSSPARARCGRTRTPTRTRGTRSRSASVWFTAYPLSLITRPGESFLAALGDEALWEAFASDRHRGGAHRAGQAGRRHLRLAHHAQRRRPLRPDQHGDRPGVRHRGRVPGDVRDGDLVRRHDHRRRRARAHRQGRRLPARRDELRRLPGHLPHGGDRAGGLAPAARRAGRPGLGQPRRRRPRSGWRRPATSSAGCSG